MGKWRTPDDPAIQMKIKIAGPRAKNIRNTQGESAAGAEREVGDASIGTHVPLDRMRSEPNRARF
jgi:hypothetical protein